MMNPDIVQRRIYEIQSTWSARERRLRAEEGRRRASQLLNLLAPAFRELRSEPRCTASAQRCLSAN